MMKPYIYLGDEIEAKCMEKFNFFKLIVMSTTSSFM